MGNGDTDQSFNGEVPGSQYSLPFFLIKTVGRWSSANRLVVLCQLILVKLGELGLHHPAEGCRKASWLEACFLAVAETSYSQPVRRNTDSCAKVPEQLNGRLQVMIDQKKLT